MQRSPSCKTSAGAAALALAAALATSPLIASAQVAAPADAAVAMSFQQVVERVVAKGYNDVREVERKGDKLYEVKARDAQGRRAELLVDARSGEILREEVKR